MNEWRAFVQEPAFQATMAVCALVHLWQALPRTLPPRLRVLANPWFWSLSALLAAAAGVAYYEHVPRLGQARIHF